MEVQNKSKRFLTGKVVSDSMEKTIVVKVERTYMHASLKKVMRISKKYKVHDEHGQAVVGDHVEIYEGRPVSKTKHMYLARVISGTSGK